VASAASSCKKEHSGVPGPPLGAASLFPSGGAATLLELTLSLRANELAGKMQAGMQKNQVWLLTALARSKPGEPLPWDERMGLTREEYAEFLRLWAERRFKPTRKVEIKVDRTAETIRLSCPGILPSVEYGLADGSLRLDDLSCDPPEKSDQPEGPLPARAGWLWRCYRPLLSGWSHFRATRTTATRDGLLTYETSDGVALALVYPLREAE
jgi:hypothetical protein